mmetsp:Transcript_65693/g.189018  ORF Transcript_65693/g.189018 Transcript_65693/m.189018 type:complete len:576 (-) Transcript_65693:77-1804(-)
MPDDFFTYQTMTREHKAEFFDELIKRTNGAWENKGGSPSGLAVQITSADMLGGKKCEETNRLLQMLAYLCMGLSDKKMGGLGDAAPQWVTNWTLEYFTKEQGWQWYKDPHAEGGEALVMIGNEDAHTTKYVTLPSPLVASRLRLHPVKWHRFPALRCEVHLTPSAERVAALVDRSLSSTRLKDSVRVATDAVTKLQGSLEEKQKAHSKKEVDLKEQAAQEIGDLERRLEEALARAEEFEARAMASEARTATAEGALLHARADNERLGAAEKRWEADGSTSEEAQAAAESRAVEKEKERLQLQASVADLSEQLMVMTDERDVLRAHEEQLEEKVSAKEEELARAHRSYVDLTQRLEQQDVEEETSNLLADEMAQLSAKAGELQDARDAAVTECGRLRTEVTQLRDDNKSLISERDKLVRKKDKLEAKKAELVDKLQMSEKARQAARERCIGLLEKRASEITPDVSLLDLASARSGGTQRSGLSAFKQLHYDTPNHSPSLGTPTDDSGAHRSSVHLPGVTIGPMSPSDSDGGIAGDVPSLKDARRKSKKELRRDSSAPTLRSSMRDSAVGSASSEPL